MKTKININYRVYSNYFIHNIVSYSCISLAQSRPKKVQNITYKNELETRNTNF